MNPQRGQRQTACMRYISAPHRSHSILSWPGAATFTSFALTEAEAGGRTGGSDIRADYVMDRRAARRARHSRDARSPTRCGACHAMPSRGAISCASRTMIARSRSEKGRIIVGDGSVGYARGAPCDGIVVGAGGAPRVSISLRDQLADGGPYRHSPRNVRSPKELMVIRATQSIRRVATRIPRAAHAQQGSSLQMQRRSGDSA